MSVWRCDQCVSVCESVVRCVCEVEVSVATCYTMCCVYVCFG